MHASERIILRLNVTGPCVFAAGMIDTRHDVEVLTANHVISCSNLL